MASFEPIREVRFGVVMYGGVSLAVYINGVSSELFSLVRATAPSRQHRTQLYHGDDELTEVERVYRKLGRLHGEPDADLEHGPVRTRFVVDIASGSSAGGINAVYLGKALANEQDFGMLRDLWVQKGDIAGLLNDRRTRKPRKGRLPVKEPVESLFSGDVMYLELLDALDRMDEPPAAGAAPAPAPPPTDDGAENDHRSPYVDDLDVWITTTNLEGAPLPIWLADSAVTERQHRHTFHFGYGALLPDSSIENDFRAASNPMLAFAARATSSFPFAFAPARLLDIARVTRHGSGGIADPLADDWKPWFAKLRSEPDYAVEEISFGDGGDMDNKPFSYVIDTLPTRTSSAPVDRRLIYIEPDPGAIKDGKRPAPRPDAVDSTITAVSLGRFEAIRDDLDRLARISQTREHLRLVKRTVDERYNANQSSGALAASRKKWIEEDAGAMAGRGLAYAAYYRLRVDALIAEYARSLVGLRWYAAETPASAAMTAVTREWVASAYSDPYDPHPPDLPSTKHFLTRFDIAFRVRRLAFVAGEADRLYLGAPAAHGSNAWTSRYQAELRRLKDELAWEEQRLRRFVPSIRSKPDDPKSDDPPTFRLDDAEVEAFRDAPDRAAWAADVWRRRHREFLDVSGGIGAFLDMLFASTRAHVKRAVGAKDDTALLDADPTHPEATARAEVWAYYARFDDFDQVLFPLQTATGSTGEDDKVEVHRFSPVDAFTLSKSGKANDHTPKVAGARLAHFGGFLDAEWRSNDIMWGRLDAAERLITLFAPAGPRRDELLEEAHDAILREEWYAPGKRGERLMSAKVMEMTPEGRRRRLQLFRDKFAPPPWPETSQMVAVSARAAHVTSGVLESVSSRPGAKVAHRVIASLAWFVTALSIVLFPRDAWRTPVRLAAVAVFAVGVGLITIGSVLNWDSATATGWPAAGVGLAALILAFVGRMARRRLALAIKLLLALAFVGLAGYGAWQLWDQLH